MAWARADERFSELSSIFFPSGTDFLALTAMMGTTNSFLLRRNMLDNAMLLRPDDESTLFKRVMSLVEKCERRRNVYAHNIWGFSEAVPDALLCMHPKTAVRSSAMVFTRGRNLTKQEKEAPPPSRAFSLVDVFTEPNLLQDLAAMRNAEVTIRLLRRALSVQTHALARAQARDQLLSILPKQQSPQPPAKKKTLRSPRRSGKPARRRQR